MKYIIGYFRKCDILTMLGTTIAFLGMYCAFKSHFCLAAFCLFLCGVCDSFDGTLARKYKYNKCQKEYGVQLDSLSDVICFGVLPAIITVLISNGFLSVIVCIFYMLAGVIRLAYFNMLHTTKTGKTGEYIGLPITTVAIVYPVVLVSLRLINSQLLSKVLPVILLILGILFISKFKLKKPNASKIASKILNKYTINLIALPMFIVLASDMFYRMKTYAVIYNIELSIFSIFNHFLPFLLMYILVTLIFIIINSLTNRSKITKIILLSITLILLIINDIKLNIMGIPIELSDVNYLNPDGMSMMATATTTIGNWIWLTIIKSIIFVAISIGLIYTDKFTKLSIKSIPKRLIVLLISALAFAGIVFAMNDKYRFFITDIYNTEKKTLDQYISVTEFTDEFGLYQGIILSAISKRDLVETEYSKQYVNKLLYSYDKVSQSGSWGKANVVFLLSESFSDLENVKEIEFDKPLMKEINSYEKDKDKMVFDLLVPTKGGASVNTEFEILTGASLSFWTQGTIPYNEYYNKETGKKAPNIIKEFNNNGYTTVYLTPWGETSYNSKTNYELFGATKTIYGKDLKGNKKGNYYSDESFMKDIYNELKDTSKGNYKFIMAASGQNHFPYPTDKYSKYDINVTNTSYSKEGTAMLKSYAQGLYDASKELNNLYEMIQDLDVPTIIVFFGDHLPYIVDSNGVDLYLASSYFNTDDEQLNYMRKFTTKAVILSNYDIETDDIEYMNASYLGAYVLNKLDLNISNYFKYIESTRTKIPVFNRQVLYKDKNIISLDKLEYDDQKAIKDYKYVQYGSFYDYTN